MTNPYIPKSYDISEIKPYTEDVKLFRIKCDMNPSPGQFLEVSIPGIGECPLASCSNNSKYVDILTRKAGNVTTALFNLKKGDKVFIRGPYGKGFPLNKLKGKDLILVAGGTGIAPVTSLIDYAEKNKKDFGKVYIYFGFRNESYILLSDRIKRWKKIFDITITLDKKEGRQSEFACETGFIHDIMKLENLEKQNTISFLCGPEIMMQCSTDKLKSLGLKEKDIYWSMERRMECGFGSCNRCLIQDVYVCKDGPVFRYDFIKPKIENENAANEII